MHVGLHCPIVCVDYQKVEVRGQVIQMSYTHLIFCALQCRWSDGCGRGGIRRFMNWQESDFRGGGGSSRTTGRKINRLKAVISS